MSDETFEEDPLPEGVATEEEQPSRVQAAATLVVEQEVSAPAQASTTSSESGSSQLAKGREAPTPAAAPDNQDSDKPIDSPPSDDTEVVEPEPEESTPSGERPTPVGRKKEAMKLADEGDQRQARIVEPGSEDSREVPLVVENSFIDGSRAIGPYSHNTPDWLIATGDSHISLVCLEATGEGDPFYSYTSDISIIVEGFPATIEIFATDGDPTRDLGFTVPIVERANQFVTDIFFGLRTAGIRAIQTEDLDSTPPDYYIPLLFDEHRLPIAYAHEAYLHDIVGHFLGAAAIEEREFAVFKALRGLLPSEVLAEIFDSYTERFIVRFGRHDRPSDDDGYLLSHTLDHLHTGYPALLGGVRGTMRQLGLGTPVVNQKGRLVLPWEVKNLSSHYQKIRERLQAAPRTTTRVNHPIS